MLSPCTKSALDNSAPFTRPPRGSLHGHTGVSCPQRSPHWPHSWPPSGASMDPFFLQRLECQGLGCCRRAPPFFPFLPGSQDGHLLQLPVSYYMFLFYYFILFSALGHQYLFKYWELLDCLILDRDCMIETPFSENASSGF